MQIVDKTSSEFLYQQVINFIQEMKTTGTIRPGDKLPSLRKLGQQLNISVPTVKQAYLELERQGLVVARPQSGYYLKAQSARNLRPIRDKWNKVEPCKVRCRSLIEKVYDGVHDPNAIPLGISNPVQAHPTDKALARMMRGVISRMSDKAASYGPPNGDKKLRTQIAFRYQEKGMRVTPEDVIITNGAQEALTISLQAVASKGDVIAVESPTFFGVLELIESLGMKALEVYTCSEDGICYQELEQAVKSHSIKACLFSTAINNPLGSLMTNAQRKNIVELLESNEIPLIEDGAYSDLIFNGEAAKPFQFYAKSSSVLTCSSFSKTAAPGYRIGYLIPGQWEKKAKQIKRSTSCSTSLLPQWTLSEYLGSGDYDRHLLQLKKKLLRNCERMRALIAEHFPPEVCISQPQGGSVLWVRCRSFVHTDQFFEQALEQGVSFAPGKIFSPSGKYHNYMRISFGINWSPEVEDAIVKLGHLVSNAHEQLGKLN